MPIKDMHQAIAVIGKAVGVERLSLDDKGACKLVINGALAVYLQEVNDEEIEVQSYIDGIGPHLSDAEMQAVYETNMGLREGRLSIEPDNGKLVFGARVRVTDFEENGLLQAIDKIIIAAAKWNTTELDALKARARAAGQEESVLSETLIRV